MILLLCCLSLVPLIGIVLYNLRHATRLEHFEPALEGIAVSILVPLVEKNDGAQLARALARTAYENSEFLLAIESGAAVPSELLAWSDTVEPKARVRWIEVPPTPAEWRAENWLAHQLAGQARGELMVFVDETLEIGPDAVGRTVSAQAALGVDALCAMPRRISATWAERALQPFLRELPVSSLFLLKNHPALPVSPEWLALTRAAYGASGGHAAVPRSPVALGAIAHRVRVHGKSATVLATGDLSVREALGWRPLWNKLVAQAALLAGARELTLLGLTILLALACVLPWVAFLIRVPHGFAALLLLAAYRLLTAELFESPGFDAIAHPLGSVLTPVLLWDSYRRLRRSAIPPALPAAAVEEDVPPALPEGTEA